MTELGAIVLAGGTGERLGGQLKSELVLGGERFLDISLSHLASADIRPVVVVAPTYVGVPGGIHHTMEDPPGGGPVAGVAAGLALLCESYPELEMVAVLTCDAPFAALAVAPLVAALPPRPMEWLPSLGRSQSTYLRSTGSQRCFVEWVTCPRGIPPRAASLGGSWSSASKYLNWRLPMWTRGRT